MLSGVEASLPDRKVPPRERHSMKVTIPSAF